ncbi:hypothetical protein [Nesterenkonia sp.]|uniref:hypothetical protein n=1 Tax=Nesterenkonia sp. TaxID=704201 RepID=UPI002627A304|nr:hypothetical protein [Nesterenkonia sp.]
MFFAVFFVFHFITPALYAQYASQSLLGLVVSCLALATLIVGTLRWALGKAPQPGRGPDGPEDDS